VSRTCEFNKCSCCGAFYYLLLYNYTHTHTLYTIVSAVMEPSPAVTKARMSMDCRFRLRFVTPASGDAAAAAALTSLAESSAEADCGAARGRRHGACGAGERGGDSYSSLSSLASAFDTHARTQPHARARIRVTASPQLAARPLTS
jgi:hypothetical protein